MRECIQRLAALAGPSGREGAVRAAIERAIAESPADTVVSADRLGNLLVRVTGRQRAEKKVLFAAHMDEVGLIVTGITEEGFLRFAEIGGIDPGVLFGHRVTVNGHVGVIGGKAVHQCSTEEKKAVPKTAGLLIDIGATNREEAERVVQPGDTAVFEDRFLPLERDRFVSKALDDRVGCALLLSLLEEPPAYDITLAFTVQEEIGLRGASTAAFALQPDIAVVVDATTAADTAGVPEQKQVCRVGGGAVISFMDRRTLYDRALYDGILCMAQEAGVPAQSKTVVAGGNDAGAIQTAGGGARVAAVSLPCRYIHSPACLLAEEDVRHTGRLLRLLADTLPAEEGL